jgi:histidine triad (HIT) family protein
MPHDSRCVFCQIVADTRKCVLLAEDQEAMAFMDIHPANSGHCLVIPKGHWPTVFEVPADAFAAVSRLLVRVATGVQRAMAPPGLSLVQANGPAAQQTVPHLHVHVLPRGDDDRLLLNWSRTGVGDLHRITEIASRIRDHLPAG